MIFSNSCFLVKEKSRGKIIKNTKLPYLQFLKFLFLSKDEKKLGRGGAIAPLGPCNKQHGERWKPYSFTFDLVG